MVDSKGLKPELEADMIGMKVDEVDIVADVEVVVVAEDMNNSEPSRSSHPAHSRDTDYIAQLAEHCSLKRHGTKVERSNRMARMILGRE